MGFIDDMNYSEGGNVRIYFRILLVFVIGQNNDTSSDVYILPLPKKDHEVVNFTIKPVPMVSSLEWPPERPKVKPDSVVNEFKSTISQPNVPDLPQWPLPLPPNETNNHFVVYECFDKLCGGWSNRLYGMIGAYFIAIIYDRSLAIKINRPCSLVHFLQPRYVQWDVDIPQNWINISFNEINGYEISFDKLKDLDKSLRNQRNPVINIHIAQTGYIALFSKVKFYRTRLLEKGFSESQLDKLTFLHFPLKYQIYDLLFKLKPYLQERKDNYLKTFDKKPLICAHVRTGGGKTIPGDAARGRMFGTKTLWAFLQEKLQINKFKDAKVFLATDDDEVREEFKKTFGHVGTEISGNIVHIDRWKSQKRTIHDKAAACHGMDKVLLDFEIMSECDLLVITWRSGFSTMPALRNRHRNELYVWRCEGGSCWIEPFYKFQNETRNLFINAIKKLPFLNCEDILYC